jgi:hypothetical protein
MGLFDFLKKSDTPKEDADKIDAANKIIEDVVSKINNSNKQEAVPPLNLDANIIHNKSILDKALDALQKSEAAMQKNEELLKAKDAKIDELLLKFGEMQNKEVERSKALETEAQNRMKIEAKSFVQKLIDEKKLEAANEDKKALFENEYLTSPEKAAKMAELLTPIIATDNKFIQKDNPLAQQKPLFIKSGLGSDLNQNEIQAAMSELTAAGTWTQ